MKPQDKGDYVTPPTEPPTCPVCGAYPFGCVRGCTARPPFGGLPPSSDNQRSGADG